MALFGVAFPVFFLAPPSLALPPSIHPSPSVTSPLLAPALGEGELKWQLQPEVLSSTVWEGGSTFLGKGIRNRDPTCFWWCFGGGNSKGIDHILMPSLIFGGRVVIVVTQKQVGQARLLWGPLLREAIAANSDKEGAEGLAIVILRGTLLTGRGMGPLWEFGGQ